MIHIAFHRESGSNAFQTNCMDPPSLCATGRTDRVGKLHLQRICGGARLYARACSLAIFPIPGGFPGPPNDMAADAICLL